MNLLNNLAPVGEEVKKKNNFGMRNPLVFNDTIGELTNYYNEETDKEQLCNIITDIKNHIDKFGVSEELLSLIPNDLSALGINTDTDKDSAIDTLNDILSVHGEVSEEGMRDLLRKVFPSLFKKTARLTNILEMELVDLDFALSEISKLTSMDLSRVFDKSIPMEIRDYKTVLSILSTIKSELTMISNINMDKILKFDINTHKKTLEVLGFVWKKGGWRNKKVPYPRQTTLRNHGYDEKNIISLGKQYLTLTPIVNKIDNIGKMSVSTNVPKEEAMQLKKSVNEFLNYFGCIEEVTYRMLNTLLSLMQYVYNVDIGV